ncbi:vacuolar import and degradation protein-domain-containing protein [Butyriboletus roseoflavus]|nr:vacuolar import and degradation protein-domain-containing protein [Butyriboletus roseoflavus]
MPVKKSHSIYSQPDTVFEDDIDMDVPQSLPPCSPSSLAPSQPSLSIKTTATSSKSTPTQQRSPSDTLPRGRPQRSSAPTPVPDPATDITRLRVRAQRHHCLYPGATFQGTQKSGRNSYDVNVTIVVGSTCVTHLSSTHALKDVDFSSSFLCGYLRIRGLTDDWPELTTYFDAEIIGSRYGFLTQKWGANEQEDMVHWQRFPAFRHVKNELRRPHLTMPDRDRGAVFMRWKERFLVPDHRVQDITGASFAGFYYVCVDFNPQSPGTNIRPVTQSFPLCAEYGEGDLLTSPSPGKLESIPIGRRRRDSSVRRGRGSSIGPRSPPPAATMSGFYFHQSSEPCVVSQLRLCIN